MAVYLSFHLPPTESPTVVVALVSKCASAGVSQCLLTHYREPNCIEVNPLTDNSVARIPGVYLPPTENPMAVVSPQTRQRQCISVPTYLLQKVQER